MQRNETKTRWHAVKPEHETKANETQEPCGILRKHVGPDKILFK
jgi:hypothetical protein